MEASFAFSTDGGGKKGACSEASVGIKDTKVDLTSIIDVVTGGGQDCAV